MSKQLRLHRKRMAGIGLVEIMVALLIGMFGVLVMMQVLSISEEQKRTTTSGNDAMNEGVLGLYSLQTDIRMAGYGVADSKLLGCSVTLPSGAVLTNLAPVVVNSPVITGQDANTDTLLMFYGETTGSPEGDNINASGNKMQTPTSFAVNDWVLVGYSTRPSPCALTLRQVQDVTGDVVTLNPAIALPAPDVNGNSRLFNMGQRYHAVGYAIRNANLTMCDFSTSSCAGATGWVSIASNMVSLRAQYGRDTTDTVTPKMDGVLDVFDQTTATTACGWFRTSAVRLALVARSSQVEKDIVTTAAPLWEGSYDALGNSDKPIVLSGFADWKQYRYKVFQTTVPLRNISWKGAVTGC